MKKQLYKSRYDRKICGVCGGFAEYFDVDPTLIRVGLALFGVVSGGTALVAYIVAAVIMEDEPEY